MKVICQLCGKKFDLERNDGVCPSCACHYHIDGEEPRQFSHNYDNSTSHVTVRTSQNYKIEERTEYAKPLQQREKRKFPLVLCIEIIIIFCLLSLPFIGRYKSNETLKEQRAENAVTEEEQSFTSDIQYHNVTISFTDLYIDTRHDWQLSDDYEVIALQYHLEFDEADSDDTYYNIGFWVIPYIATKEGLYIQPIDSYRIEELFGENELDHALACDSFSNEDGILYFALRKGDYDYLMLNMYSDDYENDTLERSINIRMNISREEAGR